MILGLCGLLAIAVIALRMYVNRDGALDRIQFPAEGLTAQRVPFALAGVVAAALLGRRCAMRMGPPENRRPRR